MSVFSRAKQAVVSNRPDHHVVLRPSAWSEKWEERPRTDVAIGLRRLPSADIDKAHAEAATEAKAECQDEEARTERFNNALVSWVVALSVCDVNDVGKPCPQLEDPEDTVRQRLTDKGIARLYAEWKILQQIKSPLAPEASDEELVELGAALTKGEAMAAMPEAKAVHLRRLARALLDELVPLSP